MLLSSQTNESFEEDIYILGEGGIIDKAEEGKCERVVCSFA